MKTKTIWDIRPGMTYNKKLVKHVQTGGNNPQYVLLTFTDGSTANVKHDQLIIT